MSKGPIGPGPYGPWALWAPSFFLPFLLASIRTRERNSPNTCYLTTHLATSNDNARAQLAQHLLPEYSPDNIQRHTPRLARSLLYERASSSFSGRHRNAASHLGGTQVLFKSQGWPECPACITWCPREPLTLFQLCSLCHPAVVVLTSVVYLSFRRIVNVRPVRPFCFTAASICGRSIFCRRLPCHAIQHVKAQRLVCKAHAVFFPLRATMQTQFAHAILHSLLAGDDEICVVVQT